MVTILIILTARQRVDRVVVVAALARGRRGSREGAGGRSSGGATASSATATASLLFLRSFRGRRPRMLLRLRMICNRHDATRLRDSF